MKTIRISEPHARAILRASETRASIGLIEGHALHELRRALQRSATPARPKRRVQGPSLTKIRKAVEKRAGFTCECGCGRWFRGAGGAATLDHFFGRTRSESIETCWRLRAECHQQKTENKPSAAHWLTRFILHAQRYGYLEAEEMAQARLDAIEMLRGPPAPWRDR